MSRPSVRLIGALYPFAAGAAAVNLFLLSLLGTWIGFPAITPAWSVVGGLALGLPAAWAFAWHIARLIERAER